MAERRPGADRPTADRGPRPAWSGRGGSRAPAGPFLALLLSVSLAAVVGLPSTAAAQELPQGVTPAMVEQGRTIYRGNGFCYTCHGRDGAGIPNLGADLTDDEWTHVDGSLDGLATIIGDGVPAEESRTGIPMPPRGGARLSPEQIRAVAAYVWTLSRSGSGGGI